MTEHSFLSNQNQTADPKPACDHATHKIVDPAATGKPTTSKLSVQKSIFWTLKVRLFKWHPTWLPLSTWHPCVIAMFPRILVYSWDSVSQVLDHSWDSAQVVACPTWYISKLPQSVFRSIGINTTKYRPLVFGSIDPNTTVVFRSIHPNTTVVFRSIHPNTSVVFRSIGPIPNVVLRSNQVGSNVAFCSINVVIRSIGCSIS